MAQGDSAAHRVARAVPSQFVPAQRRSETAFDSPSLPILSRSLCMGDNANKFTCLPTAAAATGMRNGVHEMEYGFQAQALPPP